MQVPLLYLLASPNIMAMRTAKEATVRENLDCIQRSLKHMKKTTNTMIEASLIRAKS